MTSWAMKGNEREICHAWKYTLHKHLNTNVNIICAIAQTIKGMD